MVDAVATITKPGGKPGLNSYEGTTGKVFASTRQQILENFPFYGTLLQKHGDFYRIKERYTQSSPGDIEEIELSLGAGKYELRIPTDSDELSILFEIKGEESSPNEQVERSKFFELHQTELSEEKARYHRLKARFDEKDLELDQQAKKIRDLNIEILDVERLTKARFENDIVELQAELRETKAEKEKLDRKVWEQKQELKYSDRKGGFDFFEILNSALESPTVSALAQNVFAKYQEEGSVIALPARTNPASHDPQEEPLNDSQTEDMNAVEESTNPAERQLLQSVVNNIFNFGSQKLVEQNPDLTSIKPFVDAELSKMTQSGYAFDSGNWIGIAKGLVQTAIQHNVPKEKVASVISPLLENIDIAKQGLKYSPVKVLINQLKGMYGLTLEPEEEALLKGVLKVFKKRLSA